MGALHYYLRLFLHERKIPFKVVAPNTLKKFVTGKGNSKKNQMMLHAFKKWKMEFDDDNLCDAYGLARMSLEEYKNEQ
jgi:crossover junction endodeoxyribonuclease RuvC